MNRFLVQSGNLSFQEEITRWDEAIPQGNGFCGTLIWGPSQSLRFSLDRGDLWDATPYAGIHAPEYTYRTMVKLAREGNEDEIRRIFDAPYNHPLPTKLPAGKLILDFGPDLPQTSALCIENAEASVKVGTVLINAFVHAQKHMGMIRVGCPRKDFRIRLDNPAYGLDTDAAEDVQVNSVATSSLNLLKYPPAEKGRQENLLWFFQKIGCGVEYGIFAAISEKNGATEIAWSIASSVDGENWKEISREMLRQALNNGYAAELQQHSRWWADFWEKSAVDLPDPLFNHNWYLTQYLFASCSRKGCYPMPLQGVWTADDGSLPPWKGDYHHDLNTQMSYLPYLKAGHFPEGESFLDYLWKMRDCARKFAREFYEAPGICLPSTMTQNGDSLGGWGMYSLSPTNQLWLCQSFERHWRFTGDRDFLKERAYPYLCDTAQMILHLLEMRDGKYYLPVSSSPEIHDDTIRAFLTPNSNYDLAMMRYLFTALLRMSEALEDGRKAEWEAHLDRLPELSVDKDHVLMISPDERLKESHRHFSHMIAVHPLRLLDYETPENRQIIDASILDEERLGTGLWVGYSFTWMAEMYAIARNGNGAAYQLQVFWNNYCSQNGFHLNGDYKNMGTSSFHYRPFTLEGNMCAADALQEMLLQTENRSLTLFPAIPDSWKQQEPAFRNFCAEDGVTVSASWKNGVNSLTVSAHHATQLRIRLENGLDALLQGFPTENGWAILELSDGETVHFGAAET